MRLIHIYYLVINVIIHRTHGSVNSFVEILYNCLKTQFLISPLSRRYSSYVVSLTIAPVFSISRTLLAIVLMNSKSYEVKMMEPLKLLSPSFTAVMLSRSRWFVGSSSLMTFAWDSIMRDSFARIFPPPERTFACFLASSPLNSIRPKNPLRKVSVCSSGGAYWRSQSTRLVLTPSKYLLLSFGI